MYIRSKVRSFLLLYLLLFCSSFVAAEELDSPTEEENLQTEELQIQETFPQYRMNFSHKAVQEEVYNEFLKELKDKEKSD